MDVKRFRTRYLCSSMFIWDVLAVASIELLPIAKTISMNHLFRMNRFLKLWRVVEFFKHPTILAKCPSALRLLAVIFSILIVLRWNPNMFVAVRQYLSLASGDWVYGDRELTVNEYQPCFFLSLRTLITTGYFPEPENPEDVCYFMVHSLAGVVLFASVFCHISTFLKNMKTSENTRRIKHAMGCFNTFRTEAALDEHLATLRNASIFRNCNPGLFLKLVLKLRYRGICPLEDICKQGDIGKEWYILKQGTLEVVSDDGLTVLATLTKGAVFCELSSILNIAGIKCGSRRTVNVRSVGYSRVFSLQKSDLWDALKDYPEA